MKLIFPVIFQRVFFWNFFPGIGGSSKASTTTDASTKVSTTNQQVGASEGSVAIGANSSAVIESSDPESIKAAADAIQSVAGTAISGNVDVSKTAIATTADVSKSSLRDALDFGETALDNVRRTTESANALLSRSYETYAGALKDNSGDAATTVLEKTNTEMRNVVIGIAIAFGLVFMFTRKD